MRNFTYQAKDRVRKKVKGSFQAESLTKARAELRAKGLSEIALKELRPSRGKKGKEFNISQWRKVHAAIFQQP